MRSVASALVFFAACGGAPPTSLPRCHGDPAAALPSSCPPAKPGGCVGAACLSSTFISYAGPYAAAGRVSWPRVESGVAACRASVFADFCAIRGRHHARGVRLLMQPYLDKWKVGLHLPDPTRDELDGLRAIYDTAVRAGLQVFLVMLLPAEYRDRMPDTVDDFYSKNGKTLATNIETYWNHLFKEVLAETGADGTPRVAHLAFLDVQGDLDPLNSFASPTAVVAARQEWFRRLWHLIRFGFDFIPNEQKTFELIGNADDPPAQVSAQLDWVAGELAAHTPPWPAPARVGFESYGCAKWAARLGGPAPAWRALFTAAAAHAAAMGSKLLVEEIGAMHDCDDCLNDGTEGAATYRAALSAALALGPDTPVGIWELTESNGCSAATHGYGLFGLERHDGRLTAGAAVLDEFFAP